MSIFPLVISSNITARYEHVNSSITVVMRMQSLFGV